jgi:ubiquinone/menaquinone biosynthesis C-methylase UbiE
MPFSESEQDGLNLLTQSDLVVFSPGVSTGGFAEIEMARLHPARKIIATTIDQEGLEDVREAAREAGVAERLEVLAEDLRQPSPHADHSFDFIYSRLVLHYLSFDELDFALGELRRVLKPGGTLYAVVRSVQCAELGWPTSTYDPVTHFTEFDSLRPTGTKRLQRYFHSETSIREHLEKSGFNVRSTRALDEQIYVDFQRTIKASTVANLIEAVATA